MSEDNTQFQPSTSTRRSFPIKRADAEPLTRADIQYDLLDAIFNDLHAVFTGQASEGLTSTRPKKLTFSELYSSAIMTSPRCSKVLRDKMAEVPGFGIDFAKICFLTNVGRINTTMAFFPEMRTVLRSYHPIPSLQKTQTSLQDAPRIKNCLKACFLPEEVTDPPTTPGAVMAKKAIGVIPTTNVVNLIFILSNHAITVSKSHFDPTFDFLDLFLPINISSSSRARAFLWLIFHYLESSARPNPFADEHANKYPGRISRLVSLSPDEMALENVDAKEELAYGRRMARYRSKFLQKQIADEEKERADLGTYGVMKAKFRVTIPEKAPIKMRDTGNRRCFEQSSQASPNILQRAYKRPSRSPTPRIRQQRTQPCSKLTPSPKTMLEYAWHSALLYDVLMVSDDEMADDEAKCDYARRLQILNTHVRKKELALEPEGLSPAMCSLSS